jgi:hypothetical protein
MPKYCVNLTVLFPLIEAKSLKEAMKKAYQMDWKILDIETNAGKWTDKDANEWAEQGIDTTKGDK